MTRVVEQAGLGAVAVVHVGSDGGFDLPDALHPDVLPLALAHDLPIIVVSQRGLGEADTEALLGVGGVADVASVDVVPPSLLRRRLQAHMALARARHQSQLSPAPSWQSLSGQLLLQMERVAQPRPSDSGDRGAVKECPGGGAGDEHDDNDNDGGEDEDEAAGAGQGKEKRSSGDRVHRIADGSTPHHLSVVESVLLQLDQLGRAFAADYPELSRLVVRLLRDLYSPESTVFQPGEDLFKDKCADSATREWIVETYTRRPSLAECLMTSPASGGSLKRSLSLSQAGRALKSWQFNAFDCSEDTLESLIPEIFNAELQLLKLFDVPMAVFCNFVREVRRHYQANPYHNFVHAFDVLQTVYSLLFITDAVNFLTELDIFALLVSALCHDLSHPGTNNAFQVNNLTSLALLYNDVSVLENHHVATLFRIVNDPAANADIFARLSKEQFREVRAVIIKSVLGTDMSYHFESTNLFKARTCAHRDPEDRASASLRSDVKDDRQLVMKILLHTADISNQAKPWEVASRWAVKVTEEFLAQGELERLAGGPISPGMDKTLVKMEQMTANFIELVLEPLFSALVAYFPAMGPQHALLLANKRKWRGRDAA